MTLEIDRSVTVDDVLNGALKEVFKTLMKDGLLELIGTRDDVCTVQISVSKAKTKDLPFADVAVYFDLNDKSLIALLEDKETLCRKKIIM